MVLWVTVTVSEGRHEARNRAGVGRIGSDWDSLLVLKSVCLTVWMTEVRVLLSSVGSDPS